MSVEHLSRVRRDVAAAVRAIGRAPTFALATVAILGLGVGTSAISADGSGTMSALSVYDMKPAARKVMPSAVRTAGMIRVRIRSAKKRMGRAW